MGSVPCENCGGRVTKRYARVFSPSDDPTSVRVCPECPDKVRKGGEVVEARSTGGATGSI